MKIEEIAEESKFEAYKTLENIPEEELVFTALELCAFSLDWKELDELAELFRSFNS